MKKIILYSLLFFTSHVIFAQDAPKLDSLTKKEKPKLSFKMVGSVTASVHKHNDTSLVSTFLNFGGPGLRLEYGKLAVSYCMFPSLRFFQSGKDKTLTAVPILGTGFQVSYKKIALAFPMYYLTSPRTKNNIWIMSVGLGYKL